MLYSALSLRAQTTEDRSARLIDQFGPLANGDFRGRMDLLLAEISNNSGSTAIIFTRGTPDQIAARTRYYKNQIGFRRFDAARIKFISGRNVGDIRTDMWLIPSGAPEPDFLPEAWIYKEIGSSNKSVLSAAMKTVVEESSRLGNHGTHIINYGTVVQVAQRERWIRNALAFHRFDSSRTTIVNGGPGPVRTVMWLVPPGAANPTP